MKPSFESLAIIPPDEKIPFLDRARVETENLTQSQKHWREFGYVVLPKCIPDELIQKYCKVRAKVGSLGWLNPLCYLHVPEVRDIGLFPELRKVLHELIGYEMSLSLALTAYESTQRNWHQDDYLNGPGVMTHYLAVWMALDDVSEECGPFQYVPGSHKWPLIRGHRVRRWMPYNESISDKWPKYSEKILDSVFTDRILDSNLPVQTYLPEKGDLLIWHARLAHRGSAPTNPKAVRKSLILHYTAIGKEPDAEIKANENGGFYTLRRGYETLY